MTGFDRFLNSPSVRKFREIAEKIIFAGSWPAKLAIIAGLQGNVSLTKYRIHLQRFPETVPPLRIVFASDFHVGPTTHPLHIMNGLKKISDLQPHILLLGGDFVYLAANYIDIFCRMLEKTIPAGVRKIAVLGNHDNHLNSRIITNRLRETGVTVLTNQCEFLPAPYDFISLHGLDDWISGTPDVTTAFARQAPVKIVLMHSPSNYLDLQDTAFDLAFCGHTHGGQIAFSDGRPLRAGSGPLSRQFNFGIFRLGEQLQKTLIVSRGVGFGTVPLRVNSAPEIIFCKLMPEE